MEQKLYQQLQTPNRMYNESDEIYWGLAASSSMSQTSFGGIYTMIGIIRLRQSIPLSAA